MYDRSEEAKKYPFEAPCEKDPYPEEKFFKELRKQECRIPKKGGKKQKNKYPIYK